MNLARMRLRCFLLPLLAALAAGKASSESGQCPQFMYPLLRHAMSSARRGAVLDVGANGCEVMAALKDGWRVVGVACLEAAYNELRSTAVGEHPNATLLHVCASSGAIRSAPSRYTAVMSNGSVVRLQLADPGDGYLLWQANTVAPLLPLDELIPTEERVAVIKVDVAGAQFQYEVLLGLLQTIGRDRPVIGYEEVGVRLEKHGDPSHYLKQLGYACHPHGENKHQRVCLHAESTSRSP